MARRGRHGLLAVGVLLGIYLLLGACTDVLPRPTFVVGAIYPLTGPQSQGGAQELAGVRAALTLAGSNVHLRVISAETPADAQAAVDRLVDRVDNAERSRAAGNSTIEARSDRRIERHRGAVGCGCLRGEHGWCRRRERP